MLLNVGLSRLSNGLNLSEIFLVKLLTPDFVLIAELGRSLCRLLGGMLTQIILFFAALLELLLQQKASVLRFQITILLQSAALLLRKRVAKSLLAKMLINLFLKEHLTELEISLKLLLLPLGLEVQRCFAYIEAGGRRQAKSSPHLSSVELNILHREKNRS